MALAIYKNLLKLILNYYLDMGKNNAKYKENPFS